MSDPLVYFVYWICMFTYTEEFDEQIALVMSAPLRMRCVTDYFEFFKLFFKMRRALVGRAELDKLPSKTVRNVIFERATSKSHMVTRFT